MNCLSLQRIRVKSNLRNGESKYKNCKKEMKIETNKGNRSFKMR